MSINSILDKINNFIVTNDLESTKAHIEIYQVEFKKLHKYKINRNTKLDTNKLLTLAIKHLSKDAVIYFLNTYNYDEHDIRRCCDLALRRCDYRKIFQIIDYLKELHESKVIDVLISRYLTTSLNRLFDKEKLKDKQREENTIQLIIDNNLLDEAIQTITDDELKYMLIRLNRISIIDKVLEQ